jgi:polyferredoxin
MVEGDEPKAVISGLKYYLKNRLVHRNDSRMKYAWYAYTRYIIMLAIEEKIWSMTIAE